MISYDPSHDHHPSSMPCFRASRSALTSSGRLLKIRALCFTAARAMSRLAFNASGTCWKAVKSEVTAASATSSSQRLEIGAYVEQFFGASIGMSLQYFDF